MTQKFLQGIPLVLVLTTIAFYHLTFGCLINYSTCPEGRFLQQLFDVLTEPLYTYSVGFSLGALVLLFVTKDTFNKWLLRFASWWVPVSVLLIAITPQTSGQWLPLYFIGKNLLSLALGGLMSLVTVFMVLSEKNKKFCLVVETIAAFVVGAIVVAIVLFFAFRP